MNYLYKLFMEWQFGETISKILSFILYETVYLSVVLMIGLVVFTFIRVRFLGEDFA